MTRGPTESTDSHAIFAESEADSSTSSASGLHVETNSFCFDDIDLDHIQGQSKLRANLAYCSESTSESYSAGMRTSQWILSSQFPTIEENSILTTQILSKEDVILQEVLHRTLHLSRHMKRNPIVNVVARKLPDVCEPSNCLKFNIRRSRRSMHAEQLNLVVDNSSRSKTSRSSMQHDRWPDWVHAYYRGGGEAFAPSHTSQDSAVSDSETVDCGIWASTQSATSLPVNTSQVRSWRSSFSRPLPLTIALPAALQRLRGQHSSFRFPGFCKYAIEPPLRSVCDRPTLGIDKSARCHADNKRLHMVMRCFCLA